MTQRFERRLPNTSHGVHAAHTAAQSGGMTLDALERCFYQAVVDDYHQAWDDLRRQRRAVLWEQAVAQSGVPQYLGSPDDLKLLFRKKAVSQSATSTKCTFSGVVPIDLKRFLESGVTLVECPDCACTRTLEPRGGVLRFKSHDKRKTTTPNTERRWAAKGEMAGMLSAV